ncbi:MAG: hypothetical protein HRU33_21170, partial [Rhodobacteraceae bacterium]|nr:hypothetical protein [Paracoccaceae bacterium]
MTLVRECDGSSQNKVATRLGISAAAVSQVIRKSYLGSYDNVAMRVREIYISGDIECPAIGEISSEICLHWRDEIRKGTSAGPQRILMTRFCRKCPRRPTRRQKRLPRTLSSNSSSRAGGLAMQSPERSPQELRDQLSANLRILTADLVVSRIYQKANINRTRFNRYLTGESFPRPDVLDRICRYFDVDANILLRPLGEVPETPERIALRHAIQAGRFDCAGDMPLSLMAVRAFPKTYTARCVLAQCAGAISPGEFQMLA